MNILLNGITGAMGKEVLALANNGCRGAVVTAGVDINAADEYCVPCCKSFSQIPSDAKFDCIVDFSHHSCTKELTEFAVKRGIPLVIATTGQTEEELYLIGCAAEKIPVFFASNYSLGIALLTELAKKAAETLPDAEIEIIEKHHHRKIDAPSGTALSIASAIKEARPDAVNVTGRSGYGKRTFNEIGIHAVRMGNIVGEHEVIIGTENQTITLKHEAHSRALFAEGALAAAAFIADKPAGLYNMKSMVSV